MRRESIWCVAKEKNIPKASVKGLFFLFLCCLMIGRLWILLQGEKCVVKDLPTTTHAIFYLSSRFAVASWFRNGLMSGEIDLQLCLVTREIHYNVSTWLELILTGDYLYCVVEGMIDGIGPQNKTHTEVSLGLISGHHFLIMYIQALLASSLVFSSLAVLLYCAALSTPSLACKSWEQHTLKSVREMLKIFTDKTVLALQIFFFNTSPSVKTFKKSIFHPRVIFLSLLSVERDIL